MIVTMHLQYQKTPYEKHGQNLIVKRIIQCLKYILIHFKKRKR